MTITEATIRAHWHSLRWMTRCVAVQFRFDADDLFSDLLFRLWKSRDQFHGDDKAFKQWCVCIAYNLCKDQRRYNKTRINFSFIVTPFDDDDRQIATTGDPMLLIEARDILGRFKKFVTFHHGIDTRNLLWQHAKGYSIRKNEIGAGNNAHHVRLFEAIRQARNEFKILYT